MATAPTPAAPATQVPPAPPAPPAPSPHLLRGDMQAMLTYIQGARIVSMARETAISRLKGWLIGRIWFGLMVALIVLLLARLLLPDHFPLIAALVLVILASRSGAIVSIGRRMNQDNLGIGTTGDSIFTLASLGSGRNGVAFSLLSSAVFGLVALALFASGLPGVLGLNGGIAPEFRATAISAARSRAVADRDMATRLKEAADKCAAEAAATPQGTPTPATAATPARGAATPAAGAIPAGGTPTPAITATPALGATATPVPLAIAAPGAPLAPAPAATSTTGVRPTPAATTIAGATPPATVATATATATPAAAPTPCAAADLDAKRQAANAVDVVAKASEAAAVAIANETPSRDSGDPWFSDLALALGLLSVAQFFKLLVWAFIAGFFEQFVPDMLDGLAQRGKENRAREDSAAK
ncbi:MAG: hypothetical protein JWN66_2242 [Sphingomonas bacterium]|uniref:hypothetical protein n=1 Tax=Sphingomonas bacterium TaxID=1895847 RepID=UPI002617F816|nr:hypothetical protein [Sphingomonas bacterium]MDB5705126.1 hypothetical protein [Sphingomonas bacterium]